MKVVVTRQFDVTTFNGWNNFVRTTITPFYILPPNFQYLSVITLFLNVTN